MDLQIAAIMNHFGHGTRIDIFSRYISRYGTMAIIRTAVIAIAVLLRKNMRKRIIAGFAFAGILFFLVAELGFKTVLVHEIGMRPRPYVAHADIIQPIGTHYSDASFPSSHVALTVSLVTVLIILFPATRPYAMLYALLMMRSRMHNGMHYPSDVFAGAII